MHRTSLRTYQPHVAHAVTQRAKPGPALILQADQFAGTATVTVLLISSTLVEAPLLRVTVHPDAQNGLRRPSQVMVDKAMTVKREKLGQVFGHIDSEL